MCRSRHWKQEAVELRQKRGRRGEVQAKIFTALALIAARLGHGDPTHGDD